MLARALLLAFLCLLFAPVRSDIPVHCLQEDVMGAWQLEVSPIVETDYLDCTSYQFDQSTTISLALNSPPEARDLAQPAGTGLGSWTMIGDEGMEITLAGRKFFAYFAYSTSEEAAANGEQLETVTSLCGKIGVGWVREVGNGPRHWSCFRGAQRPQLLLRGNDAASPKRPSTYTLARSAVPTAAESAAATWVDDRDWVARINAAQSSWVASPLSGPAGELISLSEAMHGAPRVPPAPKLAGLPRAKPVAAARLADLPMQWDWRNVSGRDYTGPIRDQLQCGSCYAHAALEVMESSVRIQTNLTMRPILSPQDPVSCSPYSQGCDGGFEYLVGRYAEERGVSEVRCMAYEPIDQGAVPCGWKCNDSSLWWYASSYEYIGGYYGASNEENMMRALYEKGPLAVGILCPPEFFTYRSGIFHALTSVERPAGLSRWESTAHAVVLVGWGVNATTGEKYWILKNSWGTSWGERGYMRLRRGTDEIHVESKAVFISAVTSTHPPSPLQPPPRPVPTPSPTPSRTPAPAAAPIATIAVAASMGGLAAGLLAAVIALTAVLLRTRHTNQYALAPM